MAGFPIRNAAQAALDEALAGYQHGAYVPPSKQTVAEFAEVWLDAIKLEMAETAWVNYRTVMRAYVIPRLGRVRLADLTPPRLQSLYTEPLASGRRDGSALYARTVLAGAQDAPSRPRRRSAVAAAAPQPGRRCPRPLYAAKEMTASSTEDCRWFLEATSGDRLAALWLVALNTGMRRGELAGLRWQEIDFDGSSLAVKQQRTTADYRVVVSEPKARGRRVITLDASVLDALRAHRRHQREGRRPGRAGLGGERLRLRRRDRPAVPPRPPAAHVPRRLSVRRRPVHPSARPPPPDGHGGAPSRHPSEGGAGAPGPSSIALTLDTYSHVTPTLQRAAAETLAELLSGGRASTSAHPEHG